MNMKELNKTLNMLESSLNKKLKILEKLEAEKKSLLNKTKDLKKEDFVKLEKEMAKSEMKYQILYEDVQALYKKIKVIKNNI